MANYSHLPIKGERREKRKRKRTRMGMSGKSVLTLAEINRKKSEDAKRKYSARNKENR